MKQAELAVLRAQKSSFVFQAFNLLEALTVERNILFPARLTNNYQGQRYVFCSRRCLERFEGEPWRYLEK